MVASGTGTKAEEQRICTEKWTGNVDHKAAL